MYIQMTNNATCVYASTLNKIYLKKCLEIFQTVIFFFINLLTTRKTRTTFFLYSLSGFRGEDFLEIDQPETRIAFTGHVC